MQKHCPVATPKTLMKIQLLYKVCLPPFTASGSRTKSLCTMPQQICIQTQILSSKSMNNKLISDLWLLENLWIRNWDFAKMDLLF